ncbi:uncharacterized protein Tco025E_05778, partial [Trypanosoma conorhini]
ARRFCAREEPQGQGRRVRHRDQQASPKPPQRRHGQRKHRRKPKATRAQPKLCKHMGRPQLPQGVRRPTTVRRKRLRHLLLRVAVLLPAPTPKSPLRRLPRPPKLLRVRRRKKEGANNVNLPLAVRGTKHRQQRPPPAQTTQQLRQLAVQEPQHRQPPQPERMQRRRRPATVTAAAPRHRTPSPPLRCFFCLCVRLPLR